MRVGVARSLDNWLPGHNFKMRIRIRIPPRFWRGRTQLLTPVTYVDWLESLSSPGCHLLGPLHLPARPSHPPRLMNSHDYPAQPFRLSSNFILSHFPTISLSTPRCRFHPSLTYSSLKSPPPHVILREAHCLTTFLIVSDCTNKSLIFSSPS